MHAVYVTHRTIPHVCTWLKTNGQQVTNGVLLAALDTYAFLSLHACLVVSFVFSWMDARLIEISQLSMVMSVCT